MHKKKHYNKIQQNRLRTCKNKRLKRKKCPFCVRYPHQIEDNKRLTQFFNFKKLSIQFWAKLVQVFKKQSIGRTTVNKKNRKIFMRFLAICRKFLIKIAKIQKIYQNSQKNMRERVDCNDYQNRKLLIPDSGKIGSNST